MKASRFPINSASIDMNLLVINDFNISRVSTAYRKWGKDFLNMFPNSSFTIVSKRDISFLSEHTRRVDFIPSFEEYQNHIFGFTETLYNFCTNTSHRWYIRTTEDSFVDMRYLQPFIDELETQFDPLNDFVIKGQLCRIDYDFAFLHGGSGWIMSRYAACSVNAHMDHLFDSFIEIRGGDDTIMKVIQDFYRLTDEEMNSEKFLGTPLTNSSVEMLRSNNFTDAKNCIEYDYVKNGGKPIQLNKVVFWHSGRSDNFPMLEAYDVLSRIPDNVCVVFIRHASEICWNGSSPNI